jgi:hypothetical protein
MSLGSLMPESLMADALVLASIPSTQPSHLPAHQLASRRGPRELHELITCSAVQPSKRARSTLGPTQSQILVRPAPVRFNVLTTPCHPCSVPCLAPINSTCNICRRPASCPNCLLEAASTVLCTRLYCTVRGACTHAAVMSASATHVYKIIYIYITNYIL